MSKVSNENEIEVKKRQRPTLKMQVEVLLRTAFCEECERRLLDVGLEYDHTIPLELGGDHSVENLKALCTECHKYKTAKDIKAIREAARRKNFHNSGRAKKSAPKKIKSRGFRKDVKKKMSGKVEKVDSGKEES